MSSSSDNYFVVLSRQAPVQWMGEGMDFAKLRNGHVGVDLRSGQIRMAEQRLDESNIGSVLQHVSRARVAQQVACSRCRKARVGDIPLDQIAQAVLAERLAIVGDEDVEHLRIHDQ